MKLNVRFSSRAYNERLVVTWIQKIECAIEFAWRRVLHTANYMELERMHLKKNWCNVINWLDSIERIITQIENENKHKYVMKKRKNNPKSDCTRLLF